MRWIALYCLRVVLLLQCGAWIWNLAHGKIASPLAPLQLLASAVLLAATAFSWRKGFWPSLITGDGAVIYVLVYGALFASVLLKLGAFRSVAAAWGPFRVEGPLAPLVWWAPYVLVIVLGSLVVYGALSERKTIISPDAP